MSCSTTIRATQNKLQGSESFLADGLLTNEGPSWLRQRRIVTKETDRVGQALTVALQAASRAVNRIVQIPLWIPTPANRRRLRAFRSLDDVVLQVIQGRRRSQSDPGDLLSMLMQARYEETGDRMSDRQLRDEVMTIFLAGHETTAVWHWGGRGCCYHNIRRWRYVCVRS